MINNDVFSKHKEANSLSESIVDAIEKEVFFKKKYSLANGEYPVSIIKVYELDKVCGESIIEKLDNIINLYMEEVGKEPYIIYVNDILLESLKQTDSYIPNVTNIYTSKYIQEKTVILSNSYILNIWENSIKMNGGYNGISR